MVTRWVRNTDMTSCTAQGHSKHSRHGRGTGESLDAGVAGLMRCTVRATGNRHVGGRVT